MYLLKFKILFLISILNNFIRNNYQLIDDFRMKIIVNFLQLHNLNNKFLF